MLELSAGAVDVLSARTSALPLSRQVLDSFLSEAELRRVAAFRFDGDRNRQSAATGLLRYLLSLYLGADPRTIEFIRSPEGKPFVEGGPAFNLSHSGEWILIGVAAEGRVGVDVEAHRPIANLEQLVRSTLAPDEIESVLGVEGRQRERAFYATWTRKEAYLKAVGCGLSRSLDSFSVSPFSRGDNALLRDDDDLDTPRGWSVVGLPEEPGVSAAVAWDQPGAHIRALDWSVLLSGLETDGFLGQASSRLESSEAVQFHAPLLPTQ